MELRDYLKALPDVAAREAFAKRCGTSLGHLRNVYNGSKTCSPELAVAIEQQSERAVTRQEMCPESWQRVWPELIAA